MFGSIARAIVAIMASITTTAGAMDKFAKTIDNLATVGEETSAGYVDEAREDRAIAQMDRAAARARRIKELEAINA